MMMELFLLCIVASFIQRTTGFGFGIFIKKISILYPIGVPCNFDDFTVMYQPVNDCICYYRISKYIGPF